MWARERIISVLVHRWRKRKTECLKVVPNIIWTIMPKEGNRTLKYVAPAETARKQ